MTILIRWGMSLRAFDESRPPSGVYRTMLGRYGWTDFDADVKKKGISL